jgi:hypothetical protein
MKAKFAVGVLAWVTVALAQASAETVYVKAVGETVHCTDNFGCYSIALCPKGTTSWGGGVFGDQARIISSYPFPGGWAAQFRGAYFEYASTAHANGTAFAICAGAPAGYNTVSAAQIQCTQSECSTTLSCPDNGYAITGGMSGTESLIESTYPLDAHSWAVSWYPDREAFASTAIGAAIPYAVCTDALPDGYMQVEAESQNCTYDGPSCHSYAGCPVGSAAFSGGFYGYQSKLESLAPEDDPVWVSAWYPASYEYGSVAAGAGQTIALCAAGALVVDYLFMDGFE